MKEKQRRRSNLIVFLLVVIDLSTKLLASRVMQVHENPGISFGLFGELGSLLTTVGLLLLLMFFRDLNIVSKILIFSGALANLIDRVGDFKVTDWILLSPLNLWFNIADIYLTIGVFLVGIREMRKNG